MRTDSTSRLMKVCILSFSKITFDARVVKQIQTISQHYQVDAIGYPGPGPKIEGVRYHLLSPKNKITRYLVLLLLVFARLNRRLYDKVFWLKKEYRQAYRILVAEKYDLIHANDWDSLPVAVCAARKTGSKVLFDAHEYSLAQGSESMLWRIFVAPYRNQIFVDYSDGITRSVTVCQGISDLYKERYQWSADVIMNTPPYRKMDYRPAKEGKIHLVYQGHSLPGRKLEEFIHMMPLLEEHYHLNFILMPTNLGYLSKLKAIAKRVAPERVTFYEPVPRAELIKYLGQFDIGLTWLYATQLNNYYALPNKFFDYIMAGLAIAIPPLPSMREIVEKYKVGEVCKEQSVGSMAQMLNSLSLEKINECKQNALKAALILSNETEMTKLLDIYRSLLSKVN